MTRIYLGFAAIAFLGAAVAAARDIDAAAHLLGLAIVTQGGRSELYAVYAGIQAAAAVILGLGALVPQRRAPALQFAALVFGGAALARGAAMLAPGPAGTYARASLVFESTMAVVAVLLWIRGAKIEGHRGDTG